MEIMDTYEASSFCLALILHPENGIVELVVFFILLCEWLKAQIEQRIHFYAQS